MRVLVVEDEKKLGCFLRNGLAQENLVVDLVHDGGTALTQILTQAYDAIVLDIMLPGRDGLSVLREIRRQRVNTPVLLLSARGNVNERIETSAPMTTCRSRSRSTKSSRGSGRCCVELRATMPQSCKLQTYL